VSFDVSAGAYDRFMGRYSTHLAPVFCDFSGVGHGMRVLDVGAGSGALTAELAARVGAGSVVALEPSAQFVEALPARVPGVSVLQGAAEEIPFPDGELDAALAQLVVHFMSDPAAGVGEMARVTRPGGIVAACVWDHGTGRGPLSPFWAAAKTLDLSTGGESKMVGASPGQLAGLLTDAGVHEVEETAIVVSVEHPTFEEWWEPFELGVGPAGAYVAKLESDQRAALRERCRELLPPAPFTIDAYAWSARGVT